jgi:hypothetical protein
MRVFNTRSQSEHSHRFACIFYALGFLSFAYMIGRLVLMHFELMGVTHTETLALCSLVAILGTTGARLQQRAEQQREEERFNRLADRKMEGRLS